MVKLSSLPLNTMLTVAVSDYEITVMDKEDFVQSDYFLDHPCKPWPKVCVAVKQVQSFNLRDLRNLCENIGEEAYEDWDEHVYDDLKDAPETAAFLKLVERVFESHPTYYEGENVEIDMVPLRVPKLGGTTDEV